MAESTTMTRVYTLAIRSLHMSTAKLSGPRNAPRKGPTSFLYVDGADYVAHHLTRALVNHGNFIFSNHRVGTFGRSLTSLCGVGNLQRRRNVWTRSKCGSCGCVPWSMGDASCQHVQREAGEDGKKLGIRELPKQHTSVETRCYSLPWEISDCGVVYPGPRVCRPHLWESRRGRRSWNPSRTCIRTAISKLSTLVPMHRSLQHYARLAHRYLHAHARLALAVKVEFAMSVSQKAMSHQHRLAIANAIPSSQTS